MSVAQETSMKDSLLTRILVCLLILGGTICLLAYPSLEFSASATSSVQYRSQDGIWSSVDDSSFSITRTGKRVKNSRPGHRVRLDKTALSSLLSQAPMEFSEAASKNKLMLTLPMPNRSFARFWIEESPIMEPALAARFPEIKSYRGQGIDDPTATTRFDWTPKGFHAMVLSQAGTVYVDPISSDTDYISVNKSDLPQTADTFHCNVTE